MADDLPRELAELLHPKDARARERAWSAFLDRYNRYILGTARYIAPDYDEAMDRYRYALEELRRDDFKRLRGYAAEPGSKFSTWLVVVVRRLCRDYERKKYGRKREGSGRVAREASEARRKLEDLIVEDLAPDRIADSAGSNPEREMRERELHLVLSEAVESFAPEERLLLRLRFEDELPATRIAEVLRLDSEFQVYRRLKKAMARLRERLEEEGIHDPRP